MSWCFCFVVFFFKQKTAYELRISDWSSDVCSSDLPGLSGEARCRGRMGPRVKAEGDNVRGGTLPCDHSCRLVAERSPLPPQPALAQHDFLDGDLVVGGLGGEVHEGGLDLLGQRGGRSSPLQPLFVDFAEAGDVIVRAQS